jgi:hypothetical protein
MMEIEVLLDVRLCRLVNSYDVSKRLVAFIFQSGSPRSDRVLPDPEDEGTTILRSAGTDLPVDSTAHPKRLESSNLSAVSI